MADIAELGFKVDSQPLSKANDELEKLPPRARGAEQATERFNQEVRKTGAVAKAASGSVNVLTSAVMRLATGAAAYFSIRGLVNYADAWSDMSSRVGAAIKDMEAAPALMERLVQIANDSYSPLEQTVETYGRNVSVLKALGLGAQEAADYTESLNHMLVITATRGERAASVQNALSKAMAVGKLQAEGLETVLANGSRVAEALAEELGTNVNGLRDMASQGKITSDVIARAFLKSLEDVREEAGAMTATIADGFIIMNNNITAAIGQFDKAYGVSENLANGIIFLAENLDGVAAAAAGLAAGIGVALIPILATATAGMWAFTASLLANPLTAVAVVIALVVARIVTLIQQMGGLTEAFQRVQIVAIGVWDRIKSGAQAMGSFLEGVARKLDAHFKSAFVGIAEGFANLVSSMGDAAGWVGLDASGIQSYVATIKAEAEGFHAAADAAFDAADKFWKRATGPGIQMDPIGPGWTVKEFNEIFNAANDTTAAITQVGEASGKTAKKTVEATQAVQDAFRKAKEEWDFYKGTFTGFFSDLRNNLMNGASFWDSFRDAASRALDSIANRMLEMATSNIFQMLFGAFMPNSAGPGWGVAGGFGRPGIFGVPGFSNGGYTGNGPTNAAAGVVHGREFVVNAAATQAIGVGTLQAINDNHVLPSNDNGGSVFMYNDNRVYDFSGSAMTRSEIEEILARDREEMLAALPDAIQNIESDPRKRVVKAA